MDDIPELIEPVDVTIKLIDKAATPMSGGVSGKREHMNYVNREKQVILPAQIVHADLGMKVKFSQLGADEQAKGYLVLRYIDIEAAGVELKRGHKIIKIGISGKKELDVEYYLLHSVGDPAAHFSSVGFTLVRAFFGDRKPVGD